MDTEPGEVTRLLVELNRGNEDALAQLMPLIYAELKRLAGYYLRQERPDHTLQATALVHEAYLRLVDQLGWRCEQSQPTAKVGAFLYYVKWRFFTS